MAVSPTATSKAEAAAEHVRQPVFRAVQRLGLQHVVAGHHLAVGETVILLTLSLHRY